ncbi:MAG: DUF1592 domain-containing protein [Myxococcales bacterium]|nr:DUF1592 domain-containing protein [Myxococcales bacterium]
MVLEFPSGEVKEGTISNLRGPTQALYHFCTLPLTLNTTIRRRGLLPTAALLLFPVSLFALGCDGGGGDDTGETSSPLCEGPLDPGPAPIRRLTRQEYSNTIFQLLGDNSRPGDAFVPDGEALGFSNQAVALSTSSLLVQQWADAAEHLSDTHADGLLEKMSGCSGTVDETKCNAAVSSWVASFGKRAYRRPLTTEEVASHVDLFKAGAALDGGYDPREGIRLSLEAMLQSPHFLYRVEFGEGNPVEGDVVALSSWEIATRLSYLMWNTMPDVALFEAAEADELRTPEQIEAQARRMVVAPRAREAVKNFHREWLEIDEIERIAGSGKDPEFYPDYSDDLLPLLEEETEKFLDYAIFEADASVETIFTAPYTLMNKQLAEFYDMAGPEGDEFEVVELDPTIYSGVLTQAGLLALHAKPDRSSPIHRGIFVREALLCQTPPSPPDNVPPPPEVDRMKTTREQFAMHTESTTCNSCHRLFDPIGLGFEHFDGMGRYREDEWGFPIDARGEIVETKDANGPYEGVIELGQKLSESEQVRECVSTQWFRFSYGRAETEEDACSIATIQQQFAAANYDIKELLVALTKTPAFRYRHGVGDSP